MYLAVLCFASVWYAPVVRVDVVELSHVQQSPDMTLSQLIFWSLDPKTGEYRVRDYLLVPGDYPPPHRSPVVLYGRRGVLKVYFDHAYETTTDWDPEVWDRERLPIHRRRVFLDGYLRPARIGDVLRGAQ